MFTSRAEFRLHLRIDNADERLTPVGRRFEFWCQGTIDVRSLSAEGCPRRKGCAPFFDSSPCIRQRRLRRPESKIQEIAFGQDFGRDALTTVETEIKYAGYIAQQDRQIRQLHAAERRGIPDSFCYSDIPGLSTEVREKLERVRPQTLGQAGKIPGVTPRLPWRF